MTKLNINLMPKDITTDEIRDKFLTFLKEKDHEVIPSASIVPENDPTTLFTGSGMQPMLPYLLGQVHPDGKRLVNSQKSFRAEDIEEVGDNRHTTFFEMLGNWSLGDYSKKEQLPFIFTFLTGPVGLDPSRLYVTVFAGDDSVGVPKDTESANIWQQLFKEKGIDNNIVELGTEEHGSKIGMQGGRIFYYGAKKNWWSRSGIPKAMPAGEPGGPDSEIFYDFGTDHDPHFGTECHPNCDCGRFMEIGNSVFMEYKKESNGSFSQLPQKNVDFGGGLERITAAANNNNDVFKIDTLKAIVDALSARTNKSYEDSTFRPSFRIIADHMRAAVLIMSDGVLPSKSDQGYILRRLIRRSWYHTTKLGSGDPVALLTLIPVIVEHYAKAYPNVKTLEREIYREIGREIERFEKTMSRGLLELSKKITSGNITGKDAFDLVTTHGLPFDIVVEQASENKLKIDVSEFEKNMESHRQLSRSGSAHKFKGGLGDHSEMSVKYHTATHLLHQSLRQVLGEHVLQKGSNITPDRLRFDFSHTSKLSSGEIEAVEKLINDKIKQDIPVKHEEMTVDQAKSKGALGLFGHKYGEKVSVYSIGDFSTEICGGPHVKNTGILGVFKIKKEESAGAGVRRIKAILS